MTSNIDSVRRAIERGHTGRLSYGGMALAGGRLLAGRMEPLRGRDADGRIVPEPRRDPTSVGCDPHPGAASVARKRVPACRPVVGVAAEVATWSPSSHRTPCGFPKPPERSISDRLLI